MRKFRQFVPLLGIIALSLLFLGLPEASSMFNWLECKTCSANDPYLSLLGAGYFSLLVVASLLFPNFPNRRIGKAGLVWSILLALTMTYMKLPDWCAYCLVGHLCHVLIWTIWVIAPVRRNKQVIASFNERLCLITFAPIATIALFMGLNLTFKAYGFKADSQIGSSELHFGDDMPDFSTQTVAGTPIASNDVRAVKGTVINFISPECSYCSEQLVVLNDVAEQLHGRSYRFINVTSSLKKDLMESASSIEWIEDKGSRLQRLFKVTGYPTMFVISPTGKITQVISGVPGELKNSLRNSLAKTTYN